jgi:capsule biosynthesis phosphatase
MEQPFTLIIDVDGTLCPIKRREEQYEDLVPYGAMVEKIRSYHNEGARIVLFSSRNMNSYDGNLGLINKYTAKALMDWLAQWSIPYDEIFFGKPWPGHNGFYVDDRSVRPKEFLTHTPEELATICQNDREGLE